MTPEVKLQIKEKLVNLITETEKNLASQKEDQKNPSPDNAIGRISRMGAIYDKQVTKESLNRAKERLARLQYMLSIIDTPDFGKCEYCRQPINPARILAMPESSLCIRCASFS